MYGQFEFIVASLLKKKVALSGKRERKKREKIVHWWEKWIKGWYKEQETMKFIEKKENTKLNSSNNFKSTSITK